FGWVTPLVKLGHRTVLNLADLLPLGTAMTTAHTIHHFHEAWEKEVRDRGPEAASPARVIYQLHKGKMWLTFFLMLCWLLFFMLSPIFFMRELTDYMSANSDKTVGYGVFLAIGYVICEALRSLFAHQYWCVQTTIGTGLRSMMYGAVYHKAIQLRDLSGYSVGELVNLSSSDGQRLFDASTMTCFIGTSLLMTIVVVVVTSLYVGPFAILGCSIYVFMIPLQSIVAKYSGTLRRRGVVLTDQRIRLMSELLNSMKLVKMYAWEKPFTERIAAIREQERGVLTIAAYIQSGLASIVPVAPVCAGVLTFSLTAATGGDVSASDAFATLALFNLMRFSFATVPRAVRALSETMVGLQRLKRFLLLENRQIRFPAPLKSSNVIEISNATVAWTAVTHTPTTGDPKKKGGLARSHAFRCHKVKRRRARKSANSEAALPEPQDIPVLFDINLHVPRGQLIGVCGGVGSGKSSLLSAIIGQMKVQSGQIRCGDRIAYVSQQAWIQFMSLKENILFGEDFDEEKYKHALHVACLEPDLEALPGGDATEIGERGINLSGGQKQRVSLARAVYSDCDIYLLDDPLSAVDANVGRHIFEKCLRGSLRGKTVVFVTHQLQFLPQCDRVIYMEGGRVAQDGTYAELIAEGAGAKRERRSTLGQLVRNLVEERQQNGKVGSDAPSIKTIAEAEDTKSTKEEPSEPKKDGQQLVQAELREKGAVNLSTYSKYARASGGMAVAIFVLFLFILAVALKNASDIFLSWWLGQGDGDDTNAADPGNISDNDNVDTYSLIYGMSAVALLLVTAFRAFLYNQRVLAASTHLHSQASPCIMQAPMAFFDSTPTGRILNRFAKDLDDVDVQLPAVLEQLLQNMFLIIFSLGVVAYVVPWFLIPLVPIMCFYVYLVRYFRPTQRETKRLDNISRSPLFSHLTATLQGLPTLHAFAKERPFLRELCLRLDENTMAFYSFWYSSRWFAYRLDFVTIMLTASVAVLMLILRNDIDPELAGLGLLYVSSLGGMFQFTTRLTAETEARFTAVERITGYITDLPSEAPAQRPEDPPANVWPSAGGITFRDVFVRYRPDLPPVLRNISFDIKPCEKIGIAGRTGCGKSTLMLVLYRLLELESGSIEIDGRSIAELGLHTLRSKLAIIPQDPTMFVGTVRSNLDPFDEATDEALWDALEKAHLKQTIQALPSGLMSPVVENGENFSVGERQLLCLARALLRDSRILLLDEATSSADAKTDQAIQDTIEREFSGKRTLLIIAHRLDTIVDADRIMVLDDGELMEFDSPETLLANSSSRFAQLVA
ncbi:uncharacterized protein MONBRDRAFT_82, partial [Monosiga brevicollis MX1]